MPRADSDTTNFRIGLAYACYLWIGFFFLMLISVELYSALPGNFGASQALGMTVILPMALISIGAGFLAPVLSIALRRRWGDEQGLIVLPSAELLVILALAYTEYFPGNSYVTYTSQGLFTVAALIYPLRWFLVGRRRNTVDD